MPQNYLRPASPPPSYEEVAKVSLTVVGQAEDRQNLKGSCYQQQLSHQLSTKDEKRINLDELPPEYSTAVAMTPNQISPLL
jgi:hypothetical protein